MTNNVCKICGNNKDNIIFKVKERVINEGDKFEYLECSNCKCVILNEQIDDWSKWYPSYYSAYLKPKRKINYSKKQKIMFEIILRLRSKKLFYNVLDIKGLDILLKRMYGTRIKKKDRIVDIGCANGDLLDSLYEMGYKNVTGVDLFVPETQEKRVWKFIRGDIFSLKEKYDCIIMNHSFEHMENSQEIMNKISELLAQDGVCVMSLPLSTVVCYKKYRENLGTFDAPRHIYLFSPKSMNILCNGAGLKVDRVLYDSSYVVHRVSKKFKNTNFPLYKINQILQKQKCNNKYEKMMKKINKKEMGDSAIFYISKK